MTLIIGIIILIVLIGNIEKGEWKGITQLAPIQLKI